MRGGFGVLALALAAGAWAAGGPAANQNFLVFHHPQAGDTVAPGATVGISASGRNGDPPASTVIQVKEAACDVPGPWIALPTSVSGRSVHAAYAVTGQAGASFCLRAEAPGATERWFFPQIQLSVGSRR